MPYPARAVGRGIEGDFDFHAPTGAEDIDALVWRQLRRAGEGRRTTPEIEHARCQAIGPKIRIVFETADDALGLFAEDEARERDVIAADVHHPAAADVGAVADVTGVGIEVRKE